MTERVRYLESLGATTIVMWPPIHLPGATGAPALTAEDYHRLLDEFTQYARLFIAACRGGQVPIYNPFNLIFRKLVGIDRVGYECNPAVDGRRAVDADGRSYPCYGCVGSPRYDLGTVGQPRVEGYRAFVHDRHHLLLPCEGCWAWPLCGGNALCDQIMMGADESSRAATCEFIRRFTELALGCYAQLCQEGINVFELPAAPLDKPPGCSESSV